MLRCLFPYAVCAAPLIFTACESTRSGADAGALREPLTQNAAWTFLDAPNDPFLPERPARIDCGIDGWGLEHDRIEIDTGRCNYLALVQAALTGASIGSHIEATVSHYDLTAPEPSVAHAALVVGGKTLWEQMVAIPGPAAVLNLNIEVTQAFEKGASVVFHLHNHGQNNWQVAPLFVVK